ncbi:RORC isoform 2, partial [Pan troglodytes]
QRQHRASRENVGHWAISREGQNVRPSLAPPMVQVRNPLRAGSQGHRLGQL